MRTKYPIKRLVKTYAKEIDGWRSRDVPWCEIAAEIQARHPAMRVRENSLLVAYQRLTDVSGKVVTNNDKSPARSMDAGVYLGAVKKNDVSGQVVTSGDKSLVSPSVTGLRPEKPIHVQIREAEEQRRAAAASAKFSSMLID